MTNLISKSFICLSLITFLNPSFTHADGLSVSELDLLVKEDIAAAQVLTEICPALIGNDAKFTANVAEFTQINLKRLIQSSTTLEQLQQDPEYKSAYAEAKQSSTEIDRAEQKVSCEDVLTSENQLN